MWIKLHIQRLKKPQHIIHLRQKFSWAFDNIFKMDSNLPRIITARFRSCFLIIIKKQHRRKRRSVIQIAMEELINWLIDFIKFFTFYSYGNVTIAVKGYKNKPDVCSLWRLSTWPEMAPRFLRSHPNKRLNQVAWWFWGSIQQKGVHCY